jgi:hypothetical protein
MQQGTQQPLSPAECAKQTARQLHTTALASRNCLLTSKRPDNHHHTRLTTTQSALPVFLGHGIPILLTITALAMLLTHISTFIMANNSALITATQHMRC